MADLPKVVPLKINPPTTSTTPDAPAPAQPPKQPPPALTSKHRSLQSVANVTAIPIPAFTTRVIVQAIRGTVRFTMDGSDPSNETGFQLPAGWRPFPLDWQPGMQLKVVGESPDAGFEYQPVSRNARWCY